MTGESHFQKFHHEEVSFSLIQKSSEFSVKNSESSHVAMDQYKLIPFLVGYSHP